MKKVAFLLRGGISQKTKDHSNDFFECSNKNNYVNINCVKYAIDKHIIKPNKDYSFDFFIHSWCLDLKQELLYLYNPVDFLFEKNDLYEEILLKKIKYDRKYLSQASQALAIKKVCELLEKSNQDYDKVIIYRPDLLIWKDIDLNKYKNENIYVNAHPNCEGDFHFIFSHENLKIFKTIFDSLSEDLPPMVHHYIKRHIINVFNKNNYLMDDITVAKFQEIVRKIGNTDFMKLNIEEYGITRNEILEYRM